MEAELRSDLFIGREGRFNLITISRSAGKLRFQHNRNHFNLNSIGNTVSSTLMGFPAWSCSLHEMRVPDATGQMRRVFKCDLSAIERAPFLSDKRVNTEFDDAFLVLHPREGGWHRLLFGEGWTRRSCAAHALAAASIVAANQVSID